MMCAHVIRERVLFIGTQFSILYTSMYSPAGAALYVLFSMLLLLLLLLLLFIGNPDAWSSCACTHLIPDSFVW